MKTEIKTKTLLKLFNPFESKIQHGNEYFDLHIENLSLYINHPVENDLFNPSEDKAVNLYKSLALYILNSSEDKYISVNLESDPPIQKGIFELAKAIFNKEENVIISIDENIEANKTFIKQNKLQNNTDNFISPALDENPFSEEKNILELKKDHDPYSDLDFVINEIRSLFISKYTEDGFKNILQRVNKDILNNPNFLEQLLTIKIPEINLAIIDQNELLNIRLDNPKIQSLIESDVKMGDLKSFHKLYEKYQNNPNLPVFDLKPLLNHEKTIQYLVTKNDYTYSFERDNKKLSFTMENVFNQLSDESRERKDVSLKYLDSLKKSKNMHMSNFKKFNFSILKDDDELICSFIDSVGIHHINYSDFPLKEKLKNKEFLINNLGKLETSTISNILETFITIKDITLDDYKKLIKRDPYLYCKKILANQFTTTQEKTELFVTAIKSQLNISSISIDNLSDVFLQNHDEHIEAVKKHFIISKGLNTIGKSLYEKPEDIKFFNDKYNKIEYLYFLQDEKRANTQYRYLLCHQDNSRKKMMAKIKSYEDFKTFMDNVQKVDVDFDIGVKEIYQDLNKNLQNNIKVIHDLIDMNEDHRFDFSIISEKLKFNTRVALIFLNDSTEKIHLIPQQFFKNEEFMMEFTKRLDSEHELIKRTPVFVQKFFENNNIESNYHQFFKLYVASGKLEEKISPKNTAETSNKMKI